MIMRTKVVQHVESEKVFQVLNNIPGSQLLSDVRLRWRYTHLTVRKLRRAMCASAGYLRSCARYAAGNAHDKLRNAHYMLWNAHGMMRTHARRVPAELRTICCGKCARYAAAMRTISCGPVFNFQFGHIC